MPPLQRNTKPLLRRVGNKPHATHDDHEAESLPTPPASNGTRKTGNTAVAAAAAAAGKTFANQEEDIFADPVSSSDEDDAAKLPIESKSAAFKPSRQFDVKSKSAGHTAAFKVPAGISPESTRSKRSASNGDDDVGASSSSDDKMVFSSQTTHSPNKRARMAARGNARQAGNIHATSVKTTSKYGGKKTVFTTKSRKSQESKKSGFKTAKGLGEVIEKKPQGPTFKVAKGADMFAFGKPEDDVPQFQASRGSMSDSPELSELSELESDVEEIGPRTLDLPTPKEYVPSVECKGCGKSVPVLLKQEFEDRYNHGKPLSYKRWGWFCDHHKKEDARQVWRERGYPDIKWDSFDRRLRNHHARLSAVLRKATPSVYRARLQKKVESGTTRSTNAAYNTGNDSEDEPEVKPGYYGSKGEKLMTEHILGHFADELRDLAVSDPLIGASGIAGGVSGFVQAVLVPEVAVALVKEDMKVDEKHAREILKESFGLGELLNEEAHEQVESEGEDD